MEWLKESLKTILDSFTFRRVIALPILIAVVTAVVHGSAALSDFVTRQEGRPLLGVPSIVWGILAGLLLILYFLVQHATHLRRSLAPKISVLFNANGEGIVRTPTEIYEQRDGKWSSVRTDQAVYIRITIRALSQTTVKGCVAFLTKIQKRASPTSQFSDIAIPNALPLTQNPIDVYPRVFAVVDLLKCGESDNKLGFCVPTPFLLADIFDDKATYRFTVEVNGEGVTQTIVAEVDWGGKWDGIVVR